MKNTLFEAQAPRPLADRLRPEQLCDIVGQDHLLGPDGPIGRMVTRRQLASMILWGPPGCGKTTLARLIARRTQSEFVAFSAVLAGIREIKDVMAAAEHARRLGRRTIVFVDEVHRFNKAQQDAFLPHVEAGNITLIGATTENPSFEVIAPLLSRTRVYVLRALTNEEIAGLLRRALADEERGLGREPISVADGVLERIAVFANGDARAAYNSLEAVVRAAPPDAAGKRAITEELLSAALQRKFLLYDKTGEEHYNLISALHKSVRSSDPDAALYWLARMLESGEDRMYIARRVVRMAIEDIGLADPRALEQCMAMQQCVHMLGMPEGDLAIAQAVIYLSVAQKSDAGYKALGDVMKDVREGRADPVPMHLRNAPTKAMKAWGYGSGYQHAHEFDEAVSKMECLPESLAGKHWYIPTERGMEKRIKERLEEIRNLKYR